MSPRIDASRRPRTGSGICGTIPDIALARSSGLRSSLRRLSVLARELLPGGKGFRIVRVAALVADRETARRIQCIRKLGDRHVIEEVDGAPGEQPAATVAPVDVVVAHRRDADDAVRRGFGMREHEAGRAVGIALIELDEAVV